MEATSGWNAAIRIQGRDNRIAEQSKALIALQAENARLRDAVEFFLANYAHTDYPGDQEAREIALAALAGSR